MTLANCEVCNRLFAQTVSPMCPDCAKKEEDDFERVSHYLRENRQATINEIVDALEVPKGLILKFLRMGRLEQRESLSYPCEGCSTLITKGNYCEICQVKKQLIMDQVSSGLKRTNSKSSNGSYYSRSH